MWIVIFPVNLDSIQSRVRIGMWSYVKNIVMFFLSVAFLSSGFLVSMIQSPNTSSNPSKHSLTTSILRIEEKFSLPFSYNVSIIVRRLCDEMIIYRCLPASEQIGSNGNYPLLDAFDWFRTKVPSKGIAQQSQWNLGFVKTVQFTRKSKSGICTNGFKEPRFVLMQSTSEYAISFDRPLLRQFQMT